MFRIEQQWTRLAQGGTAYRLSVDCKMNLALRSYIYVSKIQNPVTVNLIKSTPTNLLGKISPY